MYYLEGLSYMVFNDTQIEKLIVFYDVKNDKLKISPTENDLTREPFLEIFNKYINLVFQLLKNPSIININLQINYQSLFIINYPHFYLFTSFNNYSFNLLYFLTHIMGIHQSRPSFSINSLQMLNRSIVLYQKVFTA